MMKERTCRRDLTPGPDLSTLLETAKQTGNLLNFPNILVGQMGILNGLDGGVSVSLIGQVGKMFLRRRPIPPQVLVTCEAIMRYDVSPNVDNRLLDRQIVYTPPAGELSRWGFTENDVKLAQSQPGICAGSVLWVRRDSMDDDSLWMRRVLSGYYKGRLTTGGGHMEGITDVPALREAREEAGISYFYGAKPLGRADQVIAVEQDGGVVLKRYINHMWVCPVNYGLINTEPERKWGLVDYGSLRGRIESRDFTPVAECAVRLFYEWLS
jgi:hypothetical protein